MSRPTLRLGSTLLTVAAVLTGLLLAAGSASASGGSACPGAVFEHPFADWGDDATYVLAPDGAFRAGGAGWSLTGGAAPARTQALDLPAGSTATSPAMCVDLDYPTMRFKARVDGPADARLAVHVRFRLDGEGWHSLRIAELSAGESWQPTPVIRILANYLAYYDGWDHQVAFRFAPTDVDGDWQIDDVYVDPYAK